MTKRLRPSDGRENAPSRFRRQHGNVVEQTARGVSAKHQDVEAMPLDVLLARGHIDASEHAIGLRYHELWLTAGRARGGSFKYGETFGGGMSGKAAEADRECRDVERLILREFHAQGLKVFMTVCGEAVMPMSGVRIWRGDLKQAMGIAGEVLS